MKKLLVVLLALVLMTSVFTACNLDAHEHTFAKEWSTDEDYHWHACIAADGCTEQDAKAAHDFEVVEEGDKPMNKCKVCGYTNDKVSTAPEHEHVFEDEYSSNENFHWYACTVENCYEKGEKTEHAFGNPEVEYTDGKVTITSVCVDCEYKKVEVQTVDTEVQDAVAWNNVFKNFKLTNFTMDVHFKAVEGMETQHNHCVVTEDSVFYSIPGGRQFYSVRKDDGTCVTYFRRGEDTDNNLYAILDDTSDAYLTNAQKETVIQVSFEENFDKFTYDEATASYTCADVIEAICYDFSGEQSHTLYCYNNVVKITDGKISYISAEYYFDEEELKYENKSFIYSNIGISAVEIPQIVIDTAISQSEMEG